MAGAHQSAKRLEELFEVKQFIYINNGSKDGTARELSELALDNPKVKVVYIEKNIGYGNGFKKGFEASKADFVITNHADQQFDSASFYAGILSELNTLGPGYSIFSVRKGRPFSSALMTRMLRAVLSIVLGKRLAEFNGQPKLIDRSSLITPMNQFPNDFSFDLMLYLAAGNKKFYPILERQRVTGESSWNHGLRSKCKLFKAYIDSARKMKGVISTPNN